mmetsp:Transcript_8131/g.25038  ORF Transcript_8131/g.25038 Transcript_8131/m.25038 type:complete len:223 (+) Transcript_8131:1126-1794(+)
MLLRLLETLTFRSSMLYSAITSCLELYVSASESPERLTSACLAVTLYELSPRLKVGSSVVASLLHDHLIDCVLELKLCVTDTEPRSEPRSVPTCMVVSMFLPVPWLTPTSRSRPSMRSPVLTANSEAPLPVLYCQLHSGWSSSRPGLTTRRMALSGMPEFEIVPVVTPTVTPSRSVLTSTTPCCASAVPVARTCALIVRPIFVGGGGAKKEKALPWCAESFL